MNATQDNTDRAKIVLLRTDDSEASFVTRTWMCLADRVRFERAYGVSSGELAGAAQQAKAAVTDEGELIEGADTAALGAIKEEWLAYFAWLAARRCLPDVYGETDFEAFLEQLAEFDVIEGVDADGELVVVADPTPDPERKEAPAA